MRILALTFGLTVLVCLTPQITNGQAQTDSTYTVQSGDTLYGIARNVGVSVRSLMRWNDLDDTTLEVGQTLRVRPPTTPSNEDTAPSDEPSSEPSPEATPPPSEDTTEAGNVSTRYGRHSVQSGDTFVDLALRLGTTADTLFAINDSTTAALAPGTPIRIPRRFGPPTHRVQSGQTLYSIAGEYGVSVRAIKAENDLDTNTLQPGQELQIPRGTASIPPPGEWAAPDSTGRVARYPEAFAGRLTASGTAYDPEDFVVSHPSLPFNSVVLLSRPNTSGHTFARVIDRGPIEEGVLLDVSDAVARTLGVDADGKSTVALRVVWIARDTD